MTQPLTGTDGGHLAAQETTAVAAREAARTRNLLAAGLADNRVSATR
jgi:hypothetical protein